MNREIDTARAHLPDWRAVSKHERVPLDYLAARWEFLSRMGLLSAHAVGAGPQPDGATDVVFARSAGTRGVRAPNRPGSKPGGPPSSKPLVLRCIHESHAQGRALPLNTQIGRAVGLSVQRVQQIVVELIDDGELVRVADQQHMQPCYALPDAEAVPA